MESDHIKKRKKKHRNWAINKLGEHRRAIDDYRWRVEKICTSNANFITKLNKYGWLYSVLKPILKLSCIWSLCNMDRIEAITPIDQLTLDTPINRQYTKKNHLKLRKEKKWCFTWTTLIKIKSQLILLLNIHSFAAIC